MNDQLPFGSVIMWCGAVDHVPDGWLYCNGTVVQQGAYPELFKHIGHSFGNPPATDGYDPTTQFFLPDFRGYFLRGADDGAGRDPDVASRTDMQNAQAKYDGVGSVQSDEFRSHSHQYSASAYVGSGNWSGKDWNNQTQNTGNTGGSETRPLNAYVYFIIKAS
jgi:microcystin-dependent protein